VILSESSSGEDQNVTLSPVRSPTAMRDPSLLCPWGGFPLVWVRCSGYQTILIPTCEPPNPAPMYTYSFFGAYPSCLQVGEEETQEEGQIQLHQVSQALKVGVLCRATSSRWVSHDEACWCFRYEATSGSCPELPASPVPCQPLTRVTPGRGLRRFHTRHLLLWRRRSAGKEESLWRTRFEACS
jgi:hypothetical protein